MGGRTRWKFVVDEQGTILEETPAPEALTEGVTVTTAPDGTKRITAVSAEERKVLSFFVDSAPCWFEGCDELRAKYQDEVAKLGAGCPSCQKGAVIRKYQDLVRRASSATTPAG
jgi:hypothetical protein